MVSSYLFHRKASGKRQRRWEDLFFDTEEEEREWKKTRSKMEDEIRSFRDKAGRKQGQKP